MIIVILGPKINVLYYLIWFKIKVMTERARSRVQRAEMGFLRRVAGVSLRDRGRSSAIREEL